MTRKTTLYLPDDMKRAVEREAARTGRSEAEVIRAAIAQAVNRPRPKGGLFEAEPFAEKADGPFAGFGER